MNSFIVITVILAVAQAFQLSEVEEQHWKDFTLTYQKHYNGNEENMRKEIFANNLRKFAEHNKKYDAGLVSYSVGVNEFTDITPEEFKMLLRPMNVSESPKGIPFVLPSDVKAPESIDWREHNLVSAVKQQGQCGGCYAFSAVGALEGQFAKQSGSTPVDLSPQNFIDCSSSFGNKGCDGGFPQSCFKYVQATGGIDTEAAYPYTGTVGPCRYDPQNSGGVISGLVSIPSGDEGALQDAVGTVGPVSIAVNAEPIQYYHGGVFSGPCDPNHVNHAVLAVGYGTTDSGTAYWIVKNSWGAGYGQGGYILLARNNNNQCGVATDASYPVV